MEQGSLPGTRGDDRAGRAKTPLPLRESEQNRPCGGNWLHPEAQNIIQVNNAEAQQFKSMDHGLVGEKPCQTQAWLQYSASKDQGQQPDLKASPE